MIQFGVNINNREPLLIKEYTVDDMFDLAETAEELGYGSVWVGDSLLEKPRLEPISVLAGVASRTESVDIGTCCMVTSLRNPIQLTQAWATLDRISHGRMILGACMAATENERGRKQYEAVGIPPKQRALVFEEGLEVMRQLWRDGVVNYSGEYFEFEDVTFDTGNEEAPLTPVQDDLPILVTSNPSARGREAVHDPAVRRIVEVGDGWMTCCRADHPDEYRRQWEAICDHAEAVGRPTSELRTAYSITVHIADSREEAESEVRDYLSSYYPWNRGVSLDDWGPIGSADTIIDWFQEFNDLGCEIFCVRFAAYDQPAQVERFAEEVLPSF